MKLCTGPVVLTMTFSWPFCKVTKTFHTLYHEPRDHFVYTITNWTVWLWPSIMVSTVSWDDEVVHNTCCFYLYILLTFLQGHKNLEYSFNHLTLTFDHGFNSYLGCWSCVQGLLFWPWPFLYHFQSQKSYNFFILYHWPFCKVTKTIRVTLFILIFVVMLYVFGYFCIFKNVHLYNCYSFVKLIILMESS